MARTPPFVLSLCLLAANVYFVSSAPNLFSDSTVAAAPTTVIQTDTVIPTTKTTFATSTTTTTTLSKTTTTTTNAITSTNPPRMPVADNDINVAIVGGKPTAGKSFMVAIGHMENAFGTEEFTPFCGGTLIHPEWVLTAAHCLLYKSQSDTTLRVMIGGQNWWYQSQFEAISVSRIILHPRYDARMMDNDIALIKLRKKSTKNPASINILSSNEIQNTRLTVAGWGSNSDASRNVRPVLQSVSVPVYSQVACNQRHGGIKNTQICAGYAKGGMDSCFGDSGGPLYAGTNAAAILVGIVSFGDGCARPGAPGVYTRVSQFAAWIKSHGVAYKPSIAPPAPRVPIARMWRDDGRCGASFRLPNGTPAQCNPSAAGKRYCCSPIGYCGSTTNHCTAKGSVNYLKK